jgi:hypothetical protein
MTFTDLVPALGTKDDRKSKRSRRTRTRSKCKKIVW